MKTIVKLDWSPYLKTSMAETLSTQIRRAELSHTAALMRKNVMEMMMENGYGHPASCLGLADLFTVLYFGGALSVFPENPMEKSRDRMVVSCGHVSAIVYTALAMAGFFPQKRLKKYACENGLPGHLCRHEPPGVEISAGSLGQGVSVAAGMAMALREKGGNVILLSSDGEQQEGQVWEAYMAAVKFRLSNLITVIDANGIQNSGRTSEIMPMGNLYKKYKAFGFDVIEQDGHDLLGIREALHELKSGKAPGLLLLNTVPGKGVSFMENNAAWHGDLPSGIQAEQAKEELETKLKETSSWLSFLKEMS